MQGISDETDSPAQADREKDGRGGRGRGKGSSRSHKKRGGGGGKGGSGTGNASESALTQQLSRQTKNVNGQRDIQQRIPSGSHIDAPMHSHPRRGGGRDQPRGRGRGDRDKKS